MVLGGLWHGAAWTFVAWGALHGVGQVVGHERRSWREARGKAAVPDSGWRAAVGRAATFHVVCLGWLFFRADSLSTVGVMLDRLFTAWGPAPLVTPVLVLTLAGAVGAQYLPADASDRVRSVFARQRGTVQAAVLGLALLTVTTLGPQGVAPFIYYRF